MGRKQTWPRKYVLYSIACLSALFLFRCAAMDEVRRSEEVKKSLSEGHQRFIRGHYEEALIEYERVLTLSKQQPPEDEALFSIGLIYASSRYSKRDSKKAMEFFVRVVNDWPRSPLAEQAKIWIGVLHENESMTHLIKKMTSQGKSSLEIKTPSPKGDEMTGLRESQARNRRLLSAKDFDGFVKEKQKILSSADPAAPKDEALFSLGLAYAHEGNPRRDLSKSLDHFRRLLHEYPKSPWVEEAKIWVGLLQENESLQQIIQKLKQVDLEVEEKKREKSK